jgi:hypothetical protein
VENSDAGRVNLASAKRLRSKLNHAIEATDAKLAASKTALGLHSVFIFPNNLPTDNRKLCQDIHRNPVRLTLLQLDYFLICEELFVLRINRV